MAAPSRSQPSQRWSAPKLSRFQSNMSGLYGYKFRNVGLVFEASCLQKLIKQIHTERLTDTAEFIISRRLADNNNNDKMIIIIITIIIITITNHLPPDVSKREVLLIVLYNYLLEHYHDN